MVEVKFDEETYNAILDLLETAPEKFDEAIEIGLFRAGTETRNEAGENAPYKAGNLRRSLTMKPARPKTYVKVGTNLVYARIHDQGGTIPSYTIYPKSKKFLRFNINGKWVFAKKATIPARKVSPYRGKGYLTPAFDRQVGGRAASIFAEEIDKVLA